MTNATVRDATLEDARYIAAHLRPGDYQEIIAYGHGINPRILVIEGFQHADRVRVATLNDVPAILFGVNKSEHEGVGIIWMVSTPEIMKFTRKFIKGCYQEVNAIQDLYPTLYNYIHKENHISKRWLAWLGFSIDETPAGLNGNFNYFWKG